MGVTNDMHMLHGHGKERDDGAEKEDTDGRITHQLLQILLKRLSAFVDGASGQRREPLLGRELEQAKCIVPFR